MHCTLQPLGGEILLWAFNPIGNKTSLVIWSFKSCTHVVTVTVSPPVRCAMNEAYVWEYDLFDDLAIRQSLPQVQATASLQYERGKYSHLCKIRCLWDNEVSLSTELQDKWKMATGTFHGNCFCFIEFPLLLHKTLCTPCINRWRPPVALTAYCGSTISN